MDEDPFRLPYTRSPHFFYEQEKTEGDRAAGYIYINLAKIVEIYMGWKDDKPTNWTVKLEACEPTTFTLSGGKRIYEALKLYRQDP